MNEIPQRIRLVILLVYLAVLAIVSWVVFGGWIPPFSGRGLWLFSGLFALLVGNLIEAPFYSRPATVLSFTTASMIAVVSSWVAGNLVDTAVGVSVLSYLFVTCIASVLAMLLSDASPGTLSAKLGRTAYLTAEQFGRPQIVFSSVFLFALLTFHRTSVRELLIIGCTWVALVYGRPIERCVSATQRLRAIWSDERLPSDLGEIVGHNFPRILTVRHSGSATVVPGSVLVVPGDDGNPDLALALNYVGVFGGLWLRALQLRVAPALRDKLPRSVVAGRRCARVTSDKFLSDLQSLELPVLNQRQSLLGVVDPGTTAKDLRFEVVQSDREISEGRLLEITINGRPVLFQLLDGLTQEEILQQKSSRGYVVGKARKVGYWNPARQCFEPARWVPEPNAPVFLVQSTNESGTNEAIGVFPGTSYSVRVNTSDLVTHNTAILGILGVGKTFLALELVERMILDGIRVICLDLTDQYADELLPYTRPRTNFRVIERLRAIGKAGKSRVSQNVEEGGSVNEFRTAMTQLLKCFLKPSRPYRLLILNPNTFEVWRQDSKVFSGRASMASLTAAEITRIVSECTLEVLQNQGMTTSGARCCLVYEEAHTLIPEWNAIANEGDKTATNGTARAILQGRKYGLGCMVVTQRTASVTKTVLNQCNTVFALRVFDATGVDFLANYIGDDFAGVLSGLEDRHAVVFGKASSCADPVLVRLNDRAAFLGWTRTIQD